MKAMRNGIIFGAFFISLVSFSDSVHMSGSLISSYVPGVGKIRISQDSGGKFVLTHDKNSCSRDGRICTKAYYSPLTVVPRIVEDRRPQGSLVLELTPEITLTITSSSDEEEGSSSNTRYAAIVKSKVKEKLIEVPLTTLFKFEAHRE